MARSRYVAPATPWFSKWSNIALPHPDRGVQLVNLPHALIPQYLRVRREWQGADAGSGHQQRLAAELMRLERTFIDGQAVPFADTQPSEYVQSDPKGIAV